MGGEPTARVLVVTNMWPTEDAPTRGGFVRDQVVALEALRPDWAFDRLVIDGRRGRRDYARAILDLRRRIRSDRFDLLHAHYGLAGGVATFQRRVPLVTTFHGSDLYIPWQRRISSRAARVGKANIFVSGRLRSLLPGVAGHVIPCGVDPALFRPMDRDAARRGLAVGEEDVVVVFPAAPGNPVKDHGLFEATLSALPPPLRSRVRPLPLTGLRHDEVPSRLAAADVVLVTSRYEGAGNVAKEAVACGTPVVAVDVGDIGEVVEGLPGCAVVRERAPEPLAAAVAAAVGSRPGGAGLARLEALKVTRSAVARRVARVYDAVLGGGTSDAD